MKKVWPCVIAAMFVMLSGPVSHNADYYSAEEETVIISGRIIDNWWYTVQTAKVSFISDTDTTTAYTDEGGYYSITLNSQGIGIVDAKTLPEAFRFFNR